MKEYKKLIVTCILILLGMQLFASNDEPLHLEYDVVREVQFVKGKGLVISEKTHYVKTAILITKQELHLIYPNMKDSFYVLKTSIDDGTLVVKCRNTKTLVEWEFAMLIPNLNDTVINGFLINSDGQGLYFEGSTY